MGGGNKKGWKGVQELLQAAGPPNQWIPKQNEIAERSTGKTMGYHADLMAEINAIPRDEQDAFALASHEKASQATSAGRLSDEIVPVTTPGGKQIVNDNLIRASMKKEKVASLKPAFRPQGTVTAASSSALTDGGSCVLLMSEAKARELGYSADISFRSYVNTAIDPFPQLLLAPAVAIPRALSRAGLTLDDIDIFEIHEAFAAQVLSTIRALESKDFCAKFLKRNEPIGSIPMEKINPNGGSIAIGHPFAATGGRLVTSTANELRRSKKRFALISICAAGGLGGVAILERSQS